jgi:hypothetical protein
MRPTRVTLFAAVVIALTLAPSRSSPTPGEIVITAAGVEPHVFHAVAGQRVEFVKRMDVPTHVEFGWDPGQHHVYQIPGTGPVWAIFHRPGTHPYVVHVYRDNTVAVLHGIVEVVEDPQHPWGPGTCGAVVMGDCLEP